MLSFRAIAQAEWGKIVKAGRGAPLAFEKSYRLLSFFGPYLSVEEETDCECGGAHPTSVKRFKAVALPSSKPDQAAPAKLSRLFPEQEVLGALGLVLPKLTNILPQLTIAAAIGLILVMVIAAVFHATRKEYSNIGTNIVVLLLAAFIAVGYLAWVPVA